jgi:Fe-S-cluster containining protein
MTRAFGRSLCISMNHASIPGCGENQNSPAVQTPIEETFTESGDDLGSRVHSGGGIRPPKNTGNPEKRDDVTARWKKELRVTTAERETLGQCKQCGACCAFISIPPFKKDELDRLPENILQVVDWYTQNHRGRPTSPAPCYFYDMTNRRCLIHEHKPQTCRDFEPGGPACRRERSDLLPILEHYYNATRQWARNYARVVDLNGRIQEMGEFSFGDEIVEGILKDGPRASSTGCQRHRDRRPIRVGPRQRP